MLFTVWETKVPEPLIPLGMFRSLPLSAGTVLMVLMAFAFMGGLFFVTFYLQNVRGMSPVDSGLHLLPLTGMMIIGSPLAGVAITKVGPRVPLVAGMVATAAACFGMARLTPETGTLTMSLWFALLGLGLAPVMAGSVTNSFEDNWRAAALPPLTPEQAELAEKGIQVGYAPVPPGAPADVAQAIAGVAHETFVDGMGTAFTVAGVVAVLAAVVACFTKRGANAAQGAGAAHI